MASNYGSNGRLSFPRPPSLGVNIPAPKAMPSNIGPHGYRMNGPSFGTKLAAGIGQGASSFMDAYMQARAYQGQMAMMRQNQDSIMQLRRAQAERLQAQAANQKSVGGSLARMQLGMAAINHDPAYKSLIGPALKEDMENIYKNAPPETRDQLMKAMKDKQDAGDASDVKFTPDEMKFMGSYAGNKSKEAVGAAKNESAETIAAAKHHADWLQQQSKFLHDESMKTMDGTQKMRFLKQKGEIDKQLQLLRNAGSAKVAGINAEAKKANSSNSPTKLIQKSLGDELKQNGHAIDEITDSKGKLLPDSDSAIKARHQELMDRRKTLMDSYKNATGQDYEKPAGAAGPTGAQVKPPNPFPNSKEVPYDQAKGAPVGAAAYHPQQGWHLKTDQGWVAPTGGSRAPQGEEVTPPLQQAPVDASAGAPAPTEMPPQQVQGGQ